MRGGWAKSIVWSCGRPGYKPLFDMTGYVASVDGVLLNERQRIMMEMVMKDTDRRPLVVWPV